MYHVHALLIKSASHRIKERKEKKYSCSAVAVGVCELRGHGNKKSAFMASTSIGRVRKTMGVGAETDAAAKASTVLEVGLMPTFNRSMRWLVASC
jgi:hypothetical protein